jgi:hypothetical protein
MPGLPVRLREMFPRLLLADGWPSCRMRNSRAGARSRCALRGRLALQPVTPEVAGSSPVGPAKSNASERRHLAAFCVFASGSQLPLHRAVHQFGALFLHRHAEHGTREGDPPLTAPRSASAHAEVGGGCRISRLTRALRRAGRIAGATQRLSHSSAAQSPSPAAVARCAPTAPGARSSCQERRRRRRDSSRRNRLLRRRSIAR